jgi:multidrug efflux pump subunit AcrB
MNITEYAIKNKAVSYFFIAILFFGGIGAYFVLGQLEDPVFTIKKATVVTFYPGASAYEVELEVTDVIEKAMQEIPDLEHMYSFSRPGVSIIKIDIRQHIWMDTLPQIWDEIRKKIRDSYALLPPGASRPDISDDFNFVFGFVLSVTGDGFSYAELENWADDIKKELSVVTGVSRAELWGIQDKVIYIDISEKQMTELGITPQDFVDTLGRQNMVVDAGGIDVQDKRLRVVPTGEFRTPEDIGELFLHPSQARTLYDAEGPVPISTEGQTTQTARPTGALGLRPQVELIRINDIASVSAGYLEPQQAQMRTDALPAVGIQIAARDDDNIVDVGTRLEDAIRVIEARMPVGLEITKVAWQSQYVTEAINAFFLNLLGSVIIVLIVLTVPMGWRMGVIIGTGLVLTILGTFVGMTIVGYPFQRMTLGALIIAMGMMVDNSIVVADGIQVRINQGMDRVQAAIEAATKPSIALLGATVIAVMAFYPIFASRADAGEYCRGLFIVVAMSLGLSWVVALVQTPLQCLDILPKYKPKEDGEEEKDPFDTKFFNGYRRLLEFALRFRWVFMGVMVAMLVAAVYGFGYVKSMYFPYAARNQIMVDFWFDEGTRIQTVAERTRLAEEKLMADETVTTVSTFLGKGPPRLYLPVDPELPYYNNYAEILVNTGDFKEIDPLIEWFEPWIKENYPNITTRVRKFGVGPSDTWKFEWQITGPAEADVAFLREIGEKGKAILRKEPRAKEIKTSLMNRREKIVPVYDQPRGRWAGVSRDDIAFATKRAYDGYQVGLYREGDDLYPILLRNEPEERHAAASNLQLLQIKPARASQTVPLAQVTKEIRVEYEEPFINRWDRRRTVTIQATPQWWTTYPDLKKHVVDEFMALMETLPPGYDIFMDGEDESTLDNNASLNPGTPPAILIMLFIMVALYSAWRPMLIIVCTIPFALVGVTTGLLVSNSPFGFLAMLGAMSLSGMMIKNAIVLLDTVGDEIATGKTQYEAIVRSGVTRLRPVCLAAATTVLALVTLAPDAFWSAMAYTIMFGLTFGTLLTMFLVPVLYCIFYRVKSPAKA